MGAGSAGAWSLFGAGIKIGAGMIGGADPGVTTTSGRAASIARNFFA